MKMLQLTRFAKARVWNNEMVTSGFFADGVLEASATASEDALFHRGWMIGLEALLPRGAWTEYGFMAVQFIPDQLNRVLCQVPYSEQNGFIWQGSLAATVDLVRCGIPKEYSQAVLSALSTEVAGRLTSGTLRVVDAANGQVGSSPNMFARLSKAIVNLAPTLQKEMHDEELAKLLRSILLGSGSVA